VPKKDKSLTPYFYEDDANQVRAAFQAAGHLEGYASVSELIEAGTMKLVKSMQRKYNGGKPWPPVEAGALRPGRRTREESQHRKEAQYS
jgi:hypothetical protein